MVSLPAHRAYGPAGEEGTCGMTVDADADDAADNQGKAETGGGHRTGERRARADQAGPGDAKPSGAAASELPDPRKLAQDWITQWQSELAAMAADPELRESWQALVNLWSGR